MWIRERGGITLPSGVADVSAFILEGRLIRHPELPATARLPRLEITVNGRVRANVAANVPGAWRADVALSAAERAGPLELGLRLRDVAWTNALAWLGRVSGLGPLQPWRRQRRNRQLRIDRILSDTGEVVCDFSRPDAPFAVPFIRRHLRLGLNVVGFLTADLGIGESARCMVRAADAAGLDCALVDLRLPCKSRRGDASFSDRLGEPRHAVNVFHLDPPAARDIEHHHGAGLRRGRYNIGYWAWELPEFPDAWLPCFDHFDEIWCPSDFVREAIGFKAPIPVVTMPHAIRVTPPPEPPVAFRRRFELPEEAFVFLVAFDLNSYAARKNPHAALEAFRRSGLAAEGCRLVLKVHSSPGNEADARDLETLVARTPGARLIDRTLDRPDFTALLWTCDAFVSLHRSEGFGLAVAESMLLGKPVITTDWSATAEYADAATAFPVRARTVTLDLPHGPYAAGQVWAEPDLEHAAAQMRRVAGDSSLRAGVAAAGRRRVEERFAPARIGERYRQRLQAIALR
jgi:glycosyltransferase involved in cell wall biosynthesis